jgi:hypothetical protein
MTIRFGHAAAKGAAAMQACTDIGKVIWPITKLQATFCRPLWEISMQPDEIAFTC